MELSVLDIGIIISFLLLSLGIGIYFKNKASNSLSDFFLGGRNLPWFIAGISMVATTFAADTPLAVSEMVGEQGIAKNWLWWSFLTGGMLTTFFFAKLWRRAGVLTELEIIELRYSGKAGKYLRMFKSVYLGVVMNAMIIAWVNLAFNTLLIQFFNIDPNWVYAFTGATMLIAVSYTSLSGLLGVAITDTVQFIIAMTGTIVLAILVLNAPEIGGISGIKRELPASTLSFFPALNMTSSGTDIAQLFSLSIGAFLSFVAIQWWASWYPGAEPGGGGYIAQRMMSCKTERGALSASLFFQIAHYCIRPWPWIIVGLAAIVLYHPDHAQLPEAVKQSMELVTDGTYSYEEAKEFIVGYGSDESITRSVDYFYNKRLGYVYAMMDYLPSGLRGLLLVAFLAAYLSTISTQLNWGASYIVNDLLLPLKAINANNNKQLVSASRWSTIALMLIGLAATTQVTSISGVWEFVMQCGAGLGLVLILRWYWWRINAWSEIAATVAPFIGVAINYYLLIPYFDSWYETQRLDYMFVVAFTTLVWVAVTFLTPQTKNEILNKFCQRIKPRGFWGKYATQPKGSMRTSIIGFVSAVAFAHSILFAMGYLIFDDKVGLATTSAVALISAPFLFYALKRE